jgi:hypothetical protein
MPDVKYHNLAGKFPTVISAGRLGDGVGQTGDRFRFRAAKIFGHGFTR